MGQFLIPPENSLKAFWLYCVLSREFVMVWRWFWVAKRLSLKLMRLVYNCTVKLVLLIHHSGVWTWINQVAGTKHGGQRIVHIRVLWWNGTMY